ncbi:MAG: GspE/PulE family protein [Bacillota bacterium]
MIRRKLGDLLVEMGAISAEALQQAIADAGSSQRIGDYLVQQGLVTPEEVALALSQQFDLPFLTLQEISFQPDAVRSIPEAVARRYQVVPVKISGDVLTIASADPLNVLVMDDLAFLTGLEIDLVLMTAGDIERAIERVYIRGEFLANAAKHTNSLDDSIIAAPTATQSTPDDSPIVRLVDSILQQAIADHVSDIHIEPYRDQVRIRYRIDGVLQQVNTLEKDVQSGLITRLKVLAGMDISERRIPLDGAIRYAHEGGQLDLRVSTLPTIHGEKMVIRLFDPARRLASMDDLGLDQQQQQLFRRILAHPHGLVAVCGPTGSGKTTTLQVMLAELNDQSKNIITIEDPVEYQSTGVNHVQINQRIGLGFATVLRSVLRQDPDVIMVGETRDTETADIAVRSALTGHLVLTSLHTNDAPGAVTRLLDMDVEPFLVASSLVGVVAQRLVRRLCAHCRRKVTYEPTSPEALALGLEQAFTAYQPVGCPRCHRTGYRGRVGIFEIMPVNEVMREAIVQHLSIAELRQLAMQHQMQPLLQDGINKILAGTTSVTEVLRVTYQE